VTVRDEKGNAAAGCIVLIGLAVLVFLLAGACGAIFIDDSDDCYHTPGAQPGSAQDQRDVQRCIESGY
jgi:hypothetical protein